MSLAPEPFGRIAQMLEGMEGTDDDRCPRCDERLDVSAAHTDDGMEWLGFCAECNAIVEIM
jgi:hypothetical protein